MILAIFGIICAFLLILALEFLLRANLEEFFNENSVDVKKIPKLVMERKYVFDEGDDKINWVHDERLGWKLKPNSRLGITIALPLLGLGHRCVYHTDENGCRRTSKAGSGHEGPLPVISILGCSITFGHSLNDEDTYAWLLQDHFPQKRVINHAVAGYSLYQCLLVLEETIEKNKPEVVVLGFHPDLGWRNTNSFERTHLLQNIWCIPSCVSRGGRLYRYPPRGYVSLPWNKSRIMKMLELGLNRLVFGKRGDKKVIRSTMEHLLLKIRALCDKHAAKLLVACLDDSSEFYEFFINNGFCWCVTGVNVSELTPEGRFRWILYPLDNHPTPAANRQYAKAIKEAIENLLQDKYYSPDPELLKTCFKSEDKGQYIYPHY